MTNVVSRIALSPASCSEQVGSPETLLQFEHSVLFNLDLMTSPLLLGIYGTLPSNFLETFCPAEKSYQEKPFFQGSSRRVSWPRSWFELKILRPHFTLRIFTNWGDQRWKKCIFFPTQQFIGTPYISLTLSLHNGEFSVSSSPLFSSLSHS